MAAEDKNGTRDVHEKLRPEGPVGERRYLVTITEVQERIVHKQEWAAFAAEPKPVGGYLTIAHREVVKTEILRGEFTERPRISALAQLMETPHGDQ